MGGGGGNAVVRMTQQSIPGVEFWCLNTDAQVSEMAKTVYGVRCLFLLFCRVGGERVLQRSQPACIYCTSGQWRPYILSYIYNMHLVFFTLYNRQVLGGVCTAYSKPKCHRWTTQPYRYARDGVENSWKIWCVNNDSRLSDG